VKRHNNHEKGRICGYTESILSHRTHRPLVFEKISSSLSQADNADQETDGHALDIGVSAREGLDEGIDREHDCRTMSTCECNHIAECYTSVG
jgi:hypothetical protein